MRTLAVACVAALLTACSGQRVLPGNNAPNSVRSNVALSFPRVAPNTATLTIVFRIPHAAPNPRYISPSTKALTLEFDGPTMLGETVGVEKTSHGCMSSRSATICTFEIPLLTGTYRATISAYDRAPVHGKIPRGAKLLSFAKDVPFEIDSGTNHKRFVLDGVVSSLSVGSLPSGTIGTALALVPFTVTALDGDGNIIIGDYAYAVSVRDSDTSGATAIATSGSDHPPAGRLLSSRDAATFDYTGAPLVSATIRASASGAAAGSSTFVAAPALTSLSATGGLIGTHVTESIAGHFAPGLTTLNVGGTGVTVANVTASATSITATFLIDAEAATGARNVTVSTSAATSAPVSFTLSNTSVDVVMLNSDSNTGTPPGTGTGTSGDLRYEILNASPGDTIVFDTAKICGAVSCKITLGGPLPPITQNLTIDGGWFTSGSPRMTVDGANTYRAFWAESGTVTIGDLQIQNVKAQGGNGGGGTGTVGGGGGAGLGAGLFIDTATVTVFRRLLRQQRGVRRERRRAE